MTRAVGSCGFDAATQPGATATVASKVARLIARWTVRANRGEAWKGDEEGTAYGSADWFADGSLEGDATLAEAIDTRMRFATF